MRARLPADFVLLLRPEIEPDLGRDVLVGRVMARGGLARVDLGVTVLAEVRGVVEGWGQSVIVLADALLAEVEG